MPQFAADWKVPIVEIPLYRDGQWTTCPHPLADDASGDYEPLMNNAGYRKATQFHPGGDERPVPLTVWGTGIRGQKAAPGSPKYLVDVDFHPADTGQTVAVAGIVDLMNLLATWIPVVEAGYVCDEATSRWIESNR
jgi:hypothetical protein